MKDPTDLSLRLLIENVRDYAIFTLDPTGIITSWNPGAEKMKGYTAAEVVGQHFSMLYRDEDVQKDIPNHNLHIAEAEGSFIDHEGARKRKNGEIFTAEVEIVALVEDGTLIGFAKVIRDETEKIIQRNELRQANYDLDQFTAIAAHDLQEPLRMVTSYLALLDRHGSQLLDEKLNGYLKNATDGARRMQRLINYLRNLSRIGQGQLNFSPTNLKKVVDEAVANLSVRITKSGAVVSIEEPMPVVSVDHGLMIQVFQNIISNALKFQLPGSQPKINISAKPIPDNHRIIVSIKDNGIGLKPEDRERIFKPFERAAPGYFPGSGLGLSICQRVVERHHGNIWVESSPGEGSNFFFTLLPE